MFGSSLLSFQMSGPVLAALCAWRAVWAVLSHAYYVPDESWQSVEVAHGLVWPGQGLLTWEAEAGLRSSLQSLPFVAVFRLLALLGLDTQVLPSPTLLDLLLSIESDIVCRCWWCWCQGC